MPVKRRSLREGPVGLAFRQGHSQKVRLGRQVYMEVVVMGAVVVRCQDDVPRAALVPGQRLRAQPRGRRARGVQVVVLLVVHEGPLTTVGKAEAIDIERIGIGVSRETLRTSDNPTVVSAHVKQRDRP